MPLIGAMFIMLFGMNKMLWGVDMFNLKPLYFIYLLIPFSCLIIALALSKSITTFNENRSTTVDHNIIIDPGHGGVDGGATSCSGILESNINLQIAQKLNDLLQLLGMKTTMIRSDDVSIYTEGRTIAAKKISDLKERVRIVNSTENAVLVSIHQNYFSDSRYSGAQVFYADNDKSVELAKKMQDALVKTINKTSNRKVKKANGIYLMQHINCTGILVECGFLSNPTEDAKLNDPLYQKKLSCVIASVMSNYIYNGNIT